jgi:hypothetical protein
LLDGKKEKFSCPVFLLQSNLLLKKRQPMCMAASVSSIRSSLGHFKLRAYCNWTLFTGSYHRFFTRRCYRVPPKRGDQIGRKCTQWAIVYFGQIYKKFQK